MPSRPPSGVGQSSTVDPGTAEVTPIGVAVGWAGDAIAKVEPDEPVDTPEDPPRVELTAEQLALLHARPYATVVPTGYDGSTGVPIVLGLHGYSSRGENLDEWYQLSALAEARGFILALPDGSKDLTQLRFWNATDGCCNLYGSNVDDVAYLTAIIDDLESRYRVDRHRVFLIGHSNGSFMSHRMACDRADRVTAIAVLAGDVWQDASRCNPSQHVSVLQVHGTSDAVINYAGVGLFPSAEASVATWATKNGCDPARVTAGADLDLDTAGAGAETVREKHDHCVYGGAAELWRIEGGSHHPTFTPIWAEQLYDWLMAHPRP